jgi:UDP-glucose 4-epimerase
VKEFDLSLGNDVLDKSQCEKACSCIDAVYHLAAVLDEKSPMLWKVNVKGTENALEAAAKARVKQFIYMGTVGVHGGVKGTVDEKSEFKPVTKYEKSKAEAEKVVHEFHEMLPITVLRSALVLGPNGFWKQIVKLVKKGFPIIGGGKQAWQTIYVDDLVEALVFVLGKENCFGETFIVAEKGKHSLKELYEEMQAGLGLERKAKSFPACIARLGAFLYALMGKKTILTKEHVERLVRTRQYDTGKIEALGWKAKTSMHEAVEKTLAGLKS